MIWPHAQLGHISRNVTLVFTFPNWHLLMWLKFEWSTYAAAITLASVKIAVAWINIVTRWCLHGLCLARIALWPHIDLHVNLDVWWNNFVVKVEQRSKTDRKVGRNVCDVSLWQLKIQKNSWKWQRLYWDVVLLGMQRQNVNSYTESSETTTVKFFPLLLLYVALPCLIPTFRPW